MVVSGGLDQSDVPLNDVWFYNLDRNSWLSPSIDSEKSIPHLSHHAATPVFGLPHKIHDIYSKKSFPEQREKVKIIIKQLKEVFT